MYIGGTDEKGLHHLVWEIVDNSVDEYLNGHADTITVTSTSRAMPSRSDNGRGIPVGMHPEHKKPTLELILTTLHSGAKFGEGDSYVHSGGLHGVGSSVVNALSKKLRAQFVVMASSGSRSSAAARSRPRWRNWACSAVTARSSTSSRPGHLQDDATDGEWIKAASMTWPTSTVVSRSPSRMRSLGRVLTSHPGGIPEFSDDSAGGRQGRSDGTGVLRPRTTARNSRAAVDGVHG
jgi:hypothetical protein